MARPVDNLNNLLVDEKPWYKYGHLVKLNYICISLVLFSSANGYDGSIMGGLLALPRWNEFMNEPAGTGLGWITAIYWLGNGAVCPVASWVSNRYGRKTGVYFGYLFLILGVGMQAAAQNEITFTISRLFIGAASGWLATASPLLIGEIAHPTHRPILSALYMCGWFVGGTVCAWVTFGCRNIPSSWCWRLPVMLQILLPIVALPGFIMAPESPRWLISVGKVQQAGDILAKHHTGGDRQHPLVTYQMVEIETTINAEKEGNSSASYLDMVKTKGNRHRLFISITLGVFAQWCGNGVVSYYLPVVLNSVGITTVTEQTLISACLNLWNLIWAIAAAFNVERFGRRPLFLASASIMLISFIIVTGLSGSFASTGSSSLGIAVIPFLYIFNAGYAIAMTPFLTAYPCEIWQFSLRSRGLAVTWVSTVAAIFFNTFVNAIALDAIQWKYYFVFIGMLTLLWLTVYFAYPETRGHTLEQMAVIFDGENAAAPPPAFTEKTAAILNHIGAVEHKSYSTEAEKEV
ncbi:sugar transporter [Dactylonectria macrodidyma]|uniref:Sugar transporter n=1 Tax=Dactylonectria macrodidyma TaxID=307937 RepID=A0A9P9DFR5_9HYPO|nr:sugar transporter [Dactylonectria macrodidyma]